MKFALWLSLVVFAGHAQAGGFVGNGGDGFLYRNGRIVLYDFYECGSVGHLAEIQKVRENPTYLPYQMAHQLPPTILPLTEISAERNQSIRSIVLTLLQRLESLYPQITREVVSEMHTFTWTKAASDLPPNPDTEPMFPEVEGIGQVIGCARNVDGSISVSPSCLSERIPDDSLAGLVLHESFYSVYKKQNPFVVSAKPVRHFICHTFLPDVYWSYQILQDSFASFLARGGF